MFKNDQVAFLPRYRVKGTLTLATPLHVGDGRTSDKRGVTQKRDKDGKERPVKVNTVCVDVNKQAIIPGSTIKGDLLAWLGERGFSGPDMEAVFGAVQGDDPLRGGKAEFLDATLAKKAPPMSGTDETTRRYWCATRGTCVEPHVAIDPRTRTAGDHLLFHLEYVPEGSQFEVTVQCVRMSPEALLFLVRALEALNEGARLGAKSSNSWGRVSWQLLSVESTPDEKARRWLDAPTSELPYEPYCDDVGKLAVQAYNQYSMPGGSTHCGFKIEIHFDGAFLINDPSQRRERGDDPLAFATVLTREGNPYIPASSLRGALRGQAARVWRTLACGHDSENNLDLLVEAKKTGDQKKLQPFRKLFGAPGWLAPIEISDFTWLSGEKHKQEFVAIDRFTGGASDGAKFNALGLYAPVFRGTIEIDLRRLNNALDGDAKLWPWLLLAFVLRDLHEGDISIGFGAGKGYGHIASAAITSKGLPGQIAPLFEAYPFGAPLSADMQELVKHAHEELICCVKRAELPAHVEANRRGG